MCKDANVQGEGCTTDGGTEENLRGHKMSKDCSDFGSPTLNIIHFRPPHTAYLPNKDTVIKLHSFNM